MAANSFAEKDAQPSTYAPENLTTQTSFSPLSPFYNVYNRFARWRSELELPQPGAIENLQKEVKATHLTTIVFDGARADLTKCLSMNPMYQVTHSFALGSQTLPPSYNFGAMFATQKMFLHGLVDHEGSVSARFNNGWSESNVTKVQAQLSQQLDQNMIQIDHDHLGQDYSINVKAVNPSPTNFTGVFMGSYLQSITKNLAVGLEALYQRPVAQSPDMSMALHAKLAATDKSWIATAQVQHAGILQATYWQKLSEKVEVAVDLQVLSTPMRRDAIATLGAKYDFRMATFRTQLDSTGKVSAFLEQRFYPSFAFLISGEIDHFKNAAKVGVGVMLESFSAPEEMGLLPEP